MLKDIVLGAGGARGDTTASPTESKPRAQWWRSEDQFRRIADAAQEGVWALGPDGLTTFANASMIELLGCRAEAIIGRPATDFMFPEDLPDQLPRLTGSGRGQAWDCQLRLRRRSGQPLWVRVAATPLMDAHGRHVGTFAMLSDITERKRIEQPVRRDGRHPDRGNRILATLSAGNQVLVRAASERQLLEEMCRVVVEAGGHALAWIGYLRRDGQAVESKAWAAQPGQRSWPCVENGGCGAVDLAIRQGRAVVSHDIASDATFADCREPILATGCRSALTLPLRNAQEVLGAISIYSADPAAFDDDEAALLGELAADLGYGIGALRTRLAREESQRRLQASMEATIQALASIVELRDPYTAGHQRRVARLAAALGRELNLDEERVHGIYLAAVCHDIGKVQVPAEILSKPGRLTSLEFDLIKQHVDAAYEILKPIDLPWPIARIVRQHHERLDGSGYPQGIAGDALLPEARILAVADVVEAIVTHRPYRPGRGLEFALDEIRAGRGVCFDAEVVDACVRVFAERGFSFD